MYDVLERMRRDLSDLHGGETVRIVGPQGNKLVGEYALVVAKEEWNTSGAQPLIGVRPSRGQGDVVQLTRDCLRVCLVDTHLERQVITLAKEA